MAVVLGLVLAAVLPLAGTAQGKVSREGETARAMRQILARTREPRAVARLLARHGVRFLGYQESGVTFVSTGKGVVPMSSRQRTVDANFRVIDSDGGTEGRSPITPMAGEKADLTLSMWLYEWRNSDGTYSEQAAISGSWRSTEFRWVAAPADVIDVRWIVGDLVYTSSVPFDGIQRDQHTQGIASFTVGDQVKAWDLFVNFKPVSSSSYGRWTNIFANYTHTWWGVKLGIDLGAGPDGSTGTLSISTDGRTWTEGTGLALEIGSGDTRGPGVTRMMQTGLEQ